MSTVPRSLWFAALAITAAAWTTVLAQTEGGAKLEVTLRDYNGSGASHWTAVWVTTDAGAFIKTLWKQGTRYGFTSSQWTTHLPDWNRARGGPNGSTIVDGYTSATAASYTGTNSPVILTWNCRDTNNVVVPDGNYRFWVQYAEDNGAGPVTTGGLLWIKGPSGATNTYPNQAANFANMKVTWTPANPPAAPPSITSAPPLSIGQVGTPYAFTVTAAGTAPIIFSATGLPTGLAIDLNTGAISGTPSAAGTFNGTITASNGTLPNAAQNFSIVISVVPVSITSARVAGSSVVIQGTGPGGATYHVLSSLSLTQPTPQWAVIATNIITGTGEFSFTDTLDSGISQKFYQVRLP